MSKLLLVFALLTLVAIAPKLLYRSNRVAKLYGEDLRIGSSAFNATCSVGIGHDRRRALARPLTHSLARRDALRSFASTFGETGARRGRAPRDGNASSLVQREQLRRRRITRPVYGTATTSACATVRRDGAVVGLAGRGRAAKSDRTGLAANVPGLAVRSRPPARSSNMTLTGRRRCAPGTATRTSARASVRPGRSTVVAWRTTTRGSRRSDLGGRWG